MLISSGQMQVFTNRRMQRGLSLIEMMISITIGLLILAALTGVLASNSRSSKTNSRTSELQTNGRYALDHLKRELRHAGFRGYTWAEPTNPPTTPPVLTNPAGSVPECSGAGSGFVQNIRQGIWGANDSNPFAANCIPAANYNGVNSDVLVIRRAANASTPNTLAPALVANAVYFRSAYAAGEIFQGTAGPAIAGAADFAVQVSVYYIGQDDTDPTVPALRRVRLQTDTDPAAVRGSMVDEMVVSGIEHMQVQYGRATTDLNTQYFNADAITGTSTDSPTTISTYAWDDVNSVRIWLLARNSKTENGYSNTNSYEMGDLTIANGTAYTVNDSFRRQLFSVVVQLRN